MKTVLASKFLLPCAPRRYFSLFRCDFFHGAIPSQAPCHAAARADTACYSGSAERQQPGDQQYTITTSANEVDLVFTVTDKHGRFIKDLQQRDFALLDDQKAPAQVYSFTQQTNLPLRVGIVIDTSTSIRQRFQFEQQAHRSSSSRSFSRRATRPS